MKDMQHITDEKEESMDDILQSIRGVITGDKTEELVEQSDISNDTTQGEHSEDLPLELTQIVDEEHSDEIKDQKEQETVSDQEDGSDTNLSLEDEVVSLITHQTAERSSVAFKALQEQCQLKTEQNDEQKVTRSITLEELAIEAIRPELSAWLNTHLPGIVHDVVQKEIQRLVPKSV